MKRSAQVFSEDTLQVNKKIKLDIHEVNNLSLLTELKNIFVYQGDEMYVYIGKNKQGDESAEILNGLQLNKLIRPRHQSRKIINRGLVRVTYRSHGCNLFMDLNEASTHSLYPLCSINNRPVTFARLGTPLESVKTISQTRSIYNNGNNNLSGYDNDSGFILPGPSHH